MENRHADYLRAFATIEHRCRDAGKTGNISDPLREAVGLDVGVEGCFFVGGDGGEKDKSVIAWDSYPENLPGAYCPWTVSPDNTSIVESGKWEWCGFQLVEMVNWLKFIEQEFLNPWGYAIEGQVFFQEPNHGFVESLVVRNGDWHFGSPKQWCFALGGNKDCVIGVTSKPPNWFNRLAQKVLLGVHWWQVDDDYLYVNFNSDEK